jgi:hypothetical protein
MKEVTLKKLAGYELKVKSKKCLRPEDLNHIEFVQETKNDKGEVVDTSTYEFFLTNDEVQNLTKNLSVL